MDQNWMFRTTPRIVFGCGSVGQAGTEAKALGIARALLVTDPGVKAAGISGTVEKALIEAGVEVVVFDAVEPDPRIEIVAKCAAAARDGKCDGVVAVGGGSALDIGKLAAVMRTNEGPIGKYFGIDLVPSPGLPTVLLPTTSGTGSEVTPIAVLSDEGEHLKKGVVSAFLFPKAAILDPALTLGCPPGVTAASGMDALIHGIESYTSIHASRFTEFLAYKAVETIAGSLRTAYANGTDLEARTRMMEGSLWAGMAFANSGVAAVHAFAAHDVRVTCLFGDDATCTRIENRMAAESLTGDFRRRRYDRLAVITGAYAHAGQRLAHPSAMAAVCQGILRPIPAPADVSAKYSQPAEATSVTTTKPGEIKSMPASAKSIQPQALFRRVPCHSTRL